MMPRIPEPEYMDAQNEIEAYAAAGFDSVNQAFVARLLELCNGRPAASVLDLCTGPGDIPFRLKAQRPGWWIVGIDAAYNMLAYGRRGLVTDGQPDPVKFVQGDVKQLPFRVGAFDVVVSNSGLHHLPDPREFWRGIRHVAAPGALVFLRDLRRPPDTAAARRIVALHAGNESRLLQEEYYRSLLAAFTPEEVRSQLRAAELTALTVLEVADRYLDIWGILP